MLNPIYVGDLEKYVLLAILHNGNKAAVSEISRSFRKRAGYSLDSAAVAKTLNRLLNKHMLALAESNPRRTYSLTQEGRDALTDSLTRLQRMTEGLSFNKLMPPGRTQAESINLITSNAG